MMSNPVKRALRETTHLNDDVINVIWDFIPNPTNELQKKYKIIKSKLIDNDGRCERVVYGFHYHSVKSRFDTMYYLKSIIWLGREELKAYLDNNGIPYNKRWHTKRLYKLLYTF
jgi:uncharacterized Ntn-hydrolase superfamily protein